MHRVRTRAGLVPLAYALLALAVSAPLLRPGLVLSVDLAQTPSSPLSGAYWGLPYGTNSGSLARLPFDALLRLAGALGIVPLAQKLLLLAIVFLAGYGMHRLARARVAGRFYAGILYAVNPFVYERLVAGQWFLLLGYALIPWGYAAFLSAVRKNPRAPWRFAALAAVIGFADAHMAALLVVLCVITALAEGRQSRRQVGFEALALGLALCASLLWLLPTPGLSDLFSHVGHAQLEFYGTLGDPHWGPVLTVLGLGGFWNDLTPPATALAVWPLFVLLLLALALRGLAVSPNRRVAVAVAVSGALGAVAALGTASGVTRPLTFWLMDHFAFLRSFRETDKSVALLAFAYAFLGAPAVDELVGTPRRRPLAGVLGALALAVPLVYGGRELGGAWGSLHAVQFPSSWKQAAALLRSQASDSRTLFLPFQGYLKLGFANSRVVYNPAPSFFSTPILAGRWVDQVPTHQDVSDPEQNEVRALLADPSRPDLARCLAALGVSHVLLAHAADWMRLRALESRGDMQVEASWPNLTLLALRQPGALAMTAPEGSAGRCPAGLQPLPSRLVSPVRLRLLAPVPAGRQLVLGLPDASKWRRVGDDVVFTPWPSYRRVYLIAIGGLALVALSGAVAFVVVRRRASRPSRDEKTA